MVAKIVCGVKEMIAEAKVKTEYKQRISLPVIRLFAEKYGEGLTGDSKILVSSKDEV